MHRDGPDGAAVGTLLLGHGAGGGVDAPDLVAVATAAAGAGWQVLRVEQPWRVAGRRIAPAPPRLDEGWRAVVAGLRAAGDLTGPLVQGGRSAGARVACRTAAEHGAAGVLTLAFPLHPPKRPEKSRAGELALVEVPMLLVQGQRDAFGGPAEVRAALAGRPGAVVAAVPGDHALSRDTAAVAAAVVPWLTALT
ncbi:alpha/beta family hydrolase [Goekera deserti]|uniref:alpha/beta hydrolase family protein n=1 Tax=Goekera deserti TaxID=2497753 RepID=UPI001F2B5392|nr:alpha/beta family hydrolase [Goekera deserti]